MKDIDSLIGGVKDPYAELFQIQYEKIKTTGLLFRVNFKIDMLTGAYYGSSKDKRQIQLRSLKDFLEFYFNIHGNYRSNYHFPLLKTDKIKVEMSINGTFIEEKGRLSRLNFSPKNREMMNRALMTESFIRIKVILLDTDQKLRDELENLYMIHDSEKFKQELLSEIPVEHRAEAIQSNNTFVMKHMIRMGFRHSKEHIDGVLGNFDIIKQSIKEDGYVIFGGK